MNPLYAYCIVNIVTSVSRNYMWLGGGQVIVKAAWSEYCGFVVHFVDVHPIAYIRRCRCMSTLLECQKIKERASFFGD